MAISRGVNKIVVVHLHNEHYSFVKKKKNGAGILPFMTAWMDLESIMLSELRESEKDKYHMISLICGI